MRKTGQALAQIAKAVGQVAGGAALVDMGVPAAHIDKADIKLVAHQMGHALGHQTKAFGADGITSRFFHFFLNAALHGALNRKAFTHRGIQRRALIHGADDLVASLIHTAFAHRSQRHIGHLCIAAHAQRQLRGKRHGRDIALPVFLQHLDQTIHEPSLQIAAAIERLSQLNRILGFKVTARQVIGACKRHKAGLLLGIERQQAGLQRRVQAPGRIQRQSAIDLAGPRNRNRRARLVIKIAMRGHQQAVAVIGAAQKHQQKPW